MAAGLWYALYNVLLHLAALVCLPYWLFRRFASGRYRGQFRERMGLFAPGLLDAFAGRPALWVHAASAGETVSAIPVVRRLRALHPEKPILFTVTSRYGKEMATRQLGDTVDAICFSPLDLPLFCARFLRHVRPVLYLMVEIDLWPNLVRQARRRGARVAVVSGQAGPNSFPRGFWRTVFREIDVFAMQSETDARHLIRRGADPARVAVAGNLKFDSTDGRLDPAATTAWRAELGVPPDVPVLVAGSTLLEDESAVLDAVVALRADGIDLHAILAPRRQERVEPTAAACRARGLEVGLRSAGARAPVLLLDTMGELARTYNLADVAYVGGGLTPEVGLHNLLEPLVCGAPVLFGDHHGKAARIAAEFLRLGAGLEVRDGATLLAALRSVLTDAEVRARLAAAGDELLALHRGAAERSVARIGELPA